MRVARTQQGLPHRNTLTLQKLKIYFQCFPGKRGPVADRGIADVEYSLRVDGRLVDKGKTAADGLVELMVPVGLPVTLEIFGTTYDVSIAPFLEPDSTVRGQQRRLSMLGYELGTPDGTAGEKTDRAALNFQADLALQPDGTVGGATATHLTSEFGE